MSYKGSHIRGESSAQSAQMEAHVYRINPAAPKLAQLYLELGAELKIRGDLAHAQAVHETNYFRYGGLVQPTQNNYAGLGATGPDQPGASFASPTEGVLAHLQHLYAYATAESLPEGMPMVDPRFDLVTRGSAPFVGDLNGRWAVPGTHYGQSIDHILGAILMEPVPGEPYQVVPAFLSPRAANRPGPCTGESCWDGVKGIVIRRSNSPSMNAQALRDYYDDAAAARSTSTHFVVDDQSILQIVPVGELAFHTSGKNLTHLGIAVCEHNWDTPAWKETYKRLVWLTAYLSRAFQFTIADVTGHFWWDPINQPYDPTHLGWSVEQGKETGLFDWNRLIADVHASDPPPRIPVRVKRQTSIACTDGLLIDSVTYVPIRPYTSCLEPTAVVRWVDDEHLVEVDLPVRGRQKRQR